MSKIPVAIVGAGGYTGLELVKMLLSHPGFELTMLCTTEGGTTLDDLHPSLMGLENLEVVAADTKRIAAAVKLVFLALPHKTAMAYAKELLAEGLKVVDLSADYRLDRATYEAWYCLHEDPENLPKAVYGLPELFRDEIREAQLVANPGCHATASILAALPFLPYLREDLPLFADSKTGVSGAGKKCVETTHFCTDTENMYAYAPFAHRHMPEVKEKLMMASGKNWQVMFVPQMAPMVRGILVSLYGTLKEEIDAAKVLNEYYADEPFVRVRETPVHTKYTSGTNFADLFATSKGNALFVSCAIDNLMKGAAGQALHAMNVMCGFEETQGLDFAGLHPV